MGDPTWEQKAIVSSHGMSGCMIRRTECGADMKTVSAVSEAKCSIKNFATTIRARNHTNTGRTHTQDEELRDAHLWSRRCRPDFFRRCWTHSSTAALKTHGIDTQILIDTTAVATSISLLDRVYSLFSLMNGDSILTLITPLHMFESFRGQRPLA